MAIDAVKRYGEVVSHTPELKLIRIESCAALLKEPQNFFKMLRDQLQADRDTTPYRSSGWRRRISSWATHCRDRRQPGRIAPAESLTIRQRLSSEYPSVNEHQAALAKSYNAIGILQRRDGPIVRSPCVTRKVPRNRATTNTQKPERRGVSVFRRPSSQQHRRPRAAEPANRPTRLFHKSEPTRSSINWHATTPRKPIISAYLAGNYINMALLQNDTGQPPRGSELRLAGPRDTGATCS